MPLSFVEICLLFGLLAVLILALRPLQKSIENKYLKIFSKLRPRPRPSRIYEIRVSQDQDYNSEKEKD